MNNTPLSGFFGNIISTIDTLDNTDEFAYHNFSGEHSLSNSGNVDIMVNYIINYLKIAPCTYCDIGASCGVLSQKLLDLGFNSYAIDGSDYGIKNNFVVLNRDRYAVFDMSNTITPYIVNIDAKAFDLTTSFEFLEHIPLQNLDIVLSNIKLISRFHLCSIHTGGLERYNHYVIRDINWWFNKISRIGGIPTICDNVALSNFDESTVVLIKF
jgi:hypothetical protein